MAPIAWYQIFLPLIGSVFAPLFGVLLADHLIVRRRADAAVSAVGELNLPGLAARVIGGGA